MTAGNVAGGDSFDDRFEDLVPPPPEPEDGGGYRSNRRDNGRGFTSERED